MDSGERGLGFSVRSASPEGAPSRPAHPPLEMALLFVVALWLFMEACRVVTHTSVAGQAGPPDSQPEAAAASAAARQAGGSSDDDVERCGLVKRAGRTWVGFGEGLGPADMVTSAFAAAAAVRALDMLFCASLERREAVPQLIAQRTLLMSSRSGGFEVRRIQLSGANITQASLRVHAKKPADPTHEWAAELVREGEHWQLASLSLALPLPAP